MSFFVDEVKVQDVMRKDKWKKMRGFYVVPCWPTVVFSPEFILKKAWRQVVNTNMNEIANSNVSFQNYV